MGASTLVLILSQALLCSPQQCWPVLLGAKTPKGEFELVQRLTETSGYGGDVLQFYENDTEVFAIHRTWTRNPQENRAARLRSPDPKKRKSVTRGCVNVEPNVYSHLVSNFRGAQLSIVD